MMEAQKPNWRDKMIDLNSKTQITKEKLLNLEVILMDDLDVNCFSWNKIIIFIGFHRRFQDQNHQSYPRNG